MLQIVLVEPEIPQNCGNIARTCAATGSVLHLIRPLGFDISDKAVKRAGLDYWHLVDVRVYENLEDFFSRNDVREMWLLTTKAPRSYAEAHFSDGCYLFFGKETRGLDEAFLRQHPHPKRGPQPESGKLCGHRCVRGPAAAGVSPPVRAGADGPVGTVKTTNMEAKTHELQQEVCGRYGSTGQEGPAPLRF